MTGSADAFALWLQHDQAAQQVEREPEVQLELEVDVTPAPRQRPHPGDPDGLESIGSIMVRVLAELYAKQERVA